MQASGPGVKQAWGLCASPFLTEQRHRLACDRDCPKRVLAWGSGWPCFPKKADLYEPSPCALAHVLLTAALSRWCNYLPLLQMEKLGHREGRLFIKVVH